MIRQEPDCALPLTFTISGASTAVIVDTETKTLRINTNDRNLDGTAMTLEVEVTSGAEKTDKLLIKVSFIKEDQRDTIVVEQHQDLKETPEAENNAAFTGFIDLQSEMKENGVKAIASLVVDQRDYYTESAV